MADPGGHCLQPAAPFAGRIAIPARRHGCPGYDEWYVFESPQELGRLFHGNFFEFHSRRGEILVFVNSPAFVLHDPEPYMPGMLDLFWDPIEEIEPQSFVADGQAYLTLVTKNQKLTDRVQEGLSALL